MIKVSQQKKARLQQQKMSDAALPSFVHLQISTNTKITWDGTEICFLVIWISV
jgi:hypothetical protein